MRHVPVVHLRGIDSSLGDAMIERLLRTHVRIVVPQSSVDMLTDRFSADIEFGECELFGSEQVPLEAGHRLFLMGLGPFNLSSDDGKGFDVDGLEIALAIPGHLGIEAEHEWIDSLIEVFDLLPRRQDSVWQSPNFRPWMERLESSGSVMAGQSAEYWWVSDIDVADALVRILLSSEPFPKQIKISGRRSWSEEQTLEELSLLYRRTIAGRTGRFNVEHLTAAPTPTIEVQSLMVSPQLPLGVEQNARERPDLSPLHDLLYRIDGDGWRPLVPIRTALMHALADYID